LMSYAPDLESKEAVLAQVRQCKTDLMQLQAQRRDLYTRTIDVNKRVRHLEEHIAQLVSLAEKISVMECEEIKEGLS